MTDTRPDLQPTTPYPRDARRTLDTFELLPGDLVWTRSGVREVQVVTRGTAGGWRHVHFEDGIASVVHTHPWEIARMCAAGVGGDPAAGCEGWALPSTDICRHHFETYPL